MINALQVLTAMENWWHTEPSPLLDINRVERTPSSVIYVGITYLYNESREDYCKLQQDSSKLAHFRQLFTVWKAVASRLPKYEFWKDHPRSSGFNAVRAFPLYLEMALPDLYFILAENNIFLGVQFTDEDRTRIAQLRKNFIQETRHRQMHPVSAQMFSSRY